MTEKIFICLKLVSINSRRRQREIDRTLKKDEIKQFKPADDDREDAI
jgi:hypothetical protein